MANFPCPYLNGEVELTDEREKHIAERHPDLIPEYFENLRITLADPDSVRRSNRFTNARLFTKWFSSVRRGKYVVVVVVTEQEPKKRNWVVTAYMARRLEEGNLEWAKD